MVRSATLLNCNLAQPLIAANMILSDCRLGQSDSDGPDERPNRLVSAFYVAKGMAGNAGPSAALLTLPLFLFRFLPTADCLQRPSASKNRRAVFMT